MGTTGITFEFGDSLPYLEDRFLRLIGKDQATKEAMTWFKGIQATALKQASHVQCVGMHTPIPHHLIYQPTRLKVRNRGFWLKNCAKGDEVGVDRSHVLGQNTSDKQLSEITLPDGVHEPSRPRGQLVWDIELGGDEHSLTLQEFLDAASDALVYAGPGWGKTTFLHHIYLSCIKNQSALPVLITLRRPTALDDLERFVDTASMLTKKHHKASTLLLVDGYDEIDAEARVRVSEAALRYQALHIGPLYLTCREFYQVHGVALPEVRIDRFDLTDKYDFVRSFLSAYESPLDAIQVVDEFETQGFSDFLSHPLLLALACIVRTSQSPIRPGSAVRLLERAIDVLCFRWDEKKGVSRRSSTPLDGKDRLRLLKRIAFSANTLHLSASRTEGLARRSLDLMRFDRVDARQVLVEIAQFYGILVPSDSGWEFVHRVIHDFLASQYWVETGAFAKQASYHWSPRVAYAACQLQDCTDVIIAALSDKDGVPVAAEILGNSPSFDMKKVAKALTDFYAEPGRAFWQMFADQEILSCSLTPDLVCLADSGFLYYLISRFCDSRSKVGDAIIGHSLYELARRGRTPDKPLRDKLAWNFGSEGFRFFIGQYGEVTIGASGPGLRTQFP